MDTLPLTLLTLLSAAFFSGLEIAYLSANRLKIELDKNKGLLTGRILSVFTRKPSRFLGAILLGNSISLVIYGIAMSGLLEPFIIRVLPAYLQKHTVVLLIQTLIATPVILVFAEFLPKVFFRINPNLLLNALAVPAWFFYVLLFPLILSLTEISEFILKTVFRIRFISEKYVFTTVDLDHYLEEFTGDHRIRQEEEQEIRMLHNVLEFRDVIARECMVPRPEMVMIEEQAGVDELRSKYITTGLSRILVYRETVDNIIGYTHVHDLFSGPLNIPAILMPVFFVPETMKAMNLLTRFIDEHKSIAVVVDEFGGVSGLVTMEDVMEEIFGEITDEFDVDKMTEKRVSRNEFIFSGRLEIDYLNEKYRLDLPESDEFETLAGLIIHIHESIPPVGEVIHFGFYRFTILQASETRIEKVGMVILPG